MEKLRGILISWNSEKNYGFIQVGGSASLDFYYLTLTNIQSGTGAPAKGYEVEFEVSSRPRKNGQRPVAVNADVILPESKLAAGGAR